MTLRRPALAALALLAACARHVPTHAPPAPADATDLAPLDRQLALAVERAPGSTSDYRVGPEDLLEVTLFDLEEKSGEPRHVTARVSQSGSITLPLVGEVAVGSQTPVEVEATLRGCYRKYIHDPQIAVFVKEYRSYRVAVVGYVQKPGVYEVTGERSLLEVLAMAGGLNERAGKTIQISRRHDDRLETLLIDLDRLSHDGDLRLNLPMMRGDVVNVPKAGIVYVQGSVKKPGAYRLRDGMTVTQAIGAAGGPDDKLASHGAVRLFRRQPDGERQEIPVDVAAINGGQAEDLRVVENDIVIVPMSVPRYVIDRFIGGIGMGLSIPIF